VGNPECLVSEGHGARSATVCAHLVFHFTSPIKRGLCECSGPETRDLCLNGRKIVARGRLSVQISLPYKGSPFKLERRFAPGERSHLSVTSPSRSSARLAVPNRRSER
jgi:hypothetical protein